MNVERPRLGLAAVSGNFIGSAFENVWPRVSRVVEMAEADNHDIVPWGGPHAA